MLVNFQITFHPTLGDVAYVVSDVLSAITDTIKAVPRLSDKFSVKEPQLQPFYLVIRNDAECKRLQNLLNFGK